MFSFFKRKSSDTPVPQWASYLTSNEFDKFISAVSEYFTRQKIGFTMGDGEVKLDKNTVFDIENFGLVNLAQRCKQSPVKEWKAIIKDYFESLQKSVEFEKYFSSKSHDFNFAMQYLGVRLYNNDYIAYLENITPIGKSLTEDIYAMLVFDFPTTVVNVKPEQTIQWNKTNEELFAIGLENIRNNYPIDISTQNIGTTNITFVQGDHFFVPNCIRSGK